MSLRRQNPWMLANVSARLLFWAALATLPGYLLQSSLSVRLAQVVLFGWLTTVAGKRLQWIYFLTIAATITLFHVLVPSGLVVAEIAGLRITLGALRTGAFKALTIVGMVFLSLVAVRADLRLPGTVGVLAGKVFWAFEQIMERRGEITIRRPLESADGLLSSLYTDLRAMDDEAADTGARKGTAERSSAAGRLAVGAVVAFVWAGLFIPLP